MNLQLVNRTLALLRKPLSDATFRAALLNDGFDPCDIDLHLEHFATKGHVVVYAAPGHPLLLYLTLEGREALACGAREPIGFR